MLKYNLNVLKQQIYGTEKIILASDANNSISLYIRFDAPWRNFSKKDAIFLRDNEEPFIISLKNNSVTIPWEILRKAQPFYLSFIAYEEETMITTQRALIDVKESSLPQKYKTVMPSQTVFDEFVEEISEKAAAAYEEKLIEETSAVNDSLNKANAQLKETTWQLDETKAELTQAQQNLTNEIASSKSCKERLSVWNYHQWVLWSGNSEYGYGYYPQFYDFDESIKDLYIDFSMVRGAHMMFTGNALEKVKNADSVTIILSSKADSYTRVNAHLAFQNAMANACVKTLILKNCTYNFLEGAADSNISDTLIVDNDKNVNLISYGAYSNLLYKVNTSDSALKNIVIKRSNSIEHNVYIQSMTALTYESLESLINGLCTGYTMSVSKDTYNLIDDNLSLIIASKNLTVST